MSIHTNFNFWFAENFAHIHKMEESHFLHMHMENWRIGQARDPIRGLKLKKRAVVYFYSFPCVCSFEFFVTQSIYLNSLVFKLFNQTSFFQYCSYTLTNSLISLIKPLLTWLIQQRIPDLNGLHYESESL